MQGWDSSQGEEPGGNPLLSGPLSSATQGAVMNHLLKSPPTGILCCRDTGMLLECWYLLKHFVYRGSWEEDRGTHPGWRFEEAVFPGGARVPAGWKVQS